MISRDTAYWTRLCLMGALLATVAMVATRTVGYAGYFALPGAKISVAEALALLAGYMVVVGMRRAIVTRPVLLFGLAAAGIESAHVVQERFLELPGPRGGVVTLAFMLATFACWGWAAWRARGEGLSWAAACGSAVMSAMVTMTIGVCFGTFFEWYVAPSPLEPMRAWPEFQRSGWHDLAAFSIANTIDSIATHLMMAPVIALVFGAIGASFAGLLRNRMARAGA